VVTQKCLRFYYPTGGREPDHITAYHLLAPLVKIPKDLERSRLAGVYRLILADVYGTFYPPIHWTQQHHRSIAHLMVIYVIVSNQSIGACVTSHQLFQQILDHCDTPLVKYLVELQSVSTCRVCSFVCWFVCCR
jgi:hypothetical protein